MAQQSKAAVLAAALSSALILFALPQVRVAWLTAPAGLDHTRADTLTDAQRANYLAALNVMPDAKTMFMIADSELQSPNLTIEQRESAIETLMQSAARAPGDTHTWYLLADALEVETFNANRRALWDHAMSMSLLTGPFAHDLILPRARQMIDHWDTVSPELKNLWQEQTITQWGADPNGMVKLYKALTPVGQKILVETLGEVPENETD